MWRTLGSRSNIWSCQSCSFPKGCWQEGDLRLPGVTGGHEGGNGKVRHVGAQQALNIKQCRVSAPEYSCNDVRFQSTCGVCLKGSMKINIKYNQYNIEQEVKLYSSTLTSKSHQTNNLQLKLNITTLLLHKKICMASVVPHNSTMKPSCSHFFIVISKKWDNMNTWSCNFPNTTTLQCISSSSQ